VSLFVCIDLIDHGVQRASDARAKESQEYATRVNEGNEKAAATKLGVDNQYENQTSIVEETGFSTSTMELNALLSDPVTLNKGANHTFPAKAGESKDRIKSEVVGDSESHEQNKKENIISSGEGSKLSLDTVLNFANSELNPLPLVRGFCPRAKFRMI